MLNNQRLRRGHYVQDARSAERGLRLAAAGVEAGVAVDRLVFSEFRPVEIGRKIGTALHPTQRIDVNRPHPGPAGLGDLAAHIAGNLFQIVIRVGDDSARLLLEREDLAHRFLEIARPLSLDEPVGVAVLCVGVAAEVDAAP